MKSSLRGENLCLRCGHLYRKIENPQDRICQCINPILVPAEMVHKYSIHDLRTQKRITIDVEET